MESGLDRHTWEGTFWSDGNFYTWSETLVTQTCTDVSMAKEQNSLNGCILLNTNYTSIGLPYWGSIPGSGRSPAVGNGNPIQYSCLENPMDRGAWWVTVCGVAKSQICLTD